MFQGTGSDVGKSLIVAGLARAYTSRGLIVRPFKPQNMSNNAAVTPEGGEIGRAQALQARACGAESSVHMNPVLLKPQSDEGAQVIIRGQVYGNTSACSYHKLKPKLLEIVLDSFRQIADEGDLVLVEGSGSPAEINLRSGDIANMGFALAAGVPVVLVADIDRGGAIASLVGTHALLQPEERALVVGFVINKFRGNKSLLQSALEEIEKRTGFVCLGVIPWFEDAWLLPAEDSVVLERHTTPTSKEGRINIVVPRLPRIANFDDFDPLNAESGVNLHFIRAGIPIPADADLIILPGSKSTLDDLKCLQSNGWDIDILGHSRRGGLVLGLCAGFQILGRTIADRFGREGTTSGAISGLGLLDIDTEITNNKTLRHVDGVHIQTGTRISGYEMHMGITSGEGLTRPMLHLDNNRPEGALSEDGLTMGCYIHGIFANDHFRHSFLEQLGNRKLRSKAYEVRVDATLKLLGKHIEQHLDLDGLINKGTRLNKPQQSEPSNSKGI